MLLVFTPSQLNSGWRALRRYLDWDSTWVDYYAHDPFPAPGTAYGKAVGWHACHNFYARALISSPHSLRRR